jgi:chorismate dehydratase
MSLPKVSVIQYLNTVPLVWGMLKGAQHGRYDLEFTTPAACADAVRSGKAELGIIPSIEDQRIDRAQILSGISIASKEEVKSVLLLSKVPIEKVQTVAVDNSSRTAAALLRILMRKFYSRWDWATASPA